MTILLGKQAIMQKDYVKYLGVLIDSQLTFKSHMASVTKKISRTIGVMTKLRHYLNSKTLKMLYYSMVYPYLIYGIAIWGNTSNIFINPVYILQKKAVRIITNNYTFGSYIKTHSAPLFKSLKILTIHDIFTLETLKFVYDCLKKTNPIQFHNYYHFSSNMMNTASTREFKLNIPSVRTTTYGIKSLKYTGTSLWNNTPLHIRESTNRKQLIKKLKEKFTDSYT